ncbi:MAG: J domain-containing protein [Acidobacteria bacterium]|nr:J domain-containing protein [Acidobacteriota bacterium]MCA1642293.1 J domain-containing protein [Acidobacteriota bacterium]
MVDYYKVLGVKRHATAGEVKSAYRRLARLRHPDVNGGTEKAAREFALIARAYRTLTDPHERAYHDAQLLQREDDFVTGSVFRSSNPHAHRMRRVAMQARMDKRVDDMIQADRRENLAMQQAVFTTVSLFLSTFFVALFKPRLWQMFGMAGRVLLFALFLVGMWHLFKRLRDYFSRYTYHPQPLHDSITEEAGAGKPFTRFAASSFLIVGYAAALGMGLLLGQQMNETILSFVPGFDTHIRPEMLFYPPIAVLIVDTMHTVASKID